MTTYCTYIFLMLSFFLHKAQPYKSINNTCGGNKL